MGQSLLLVTSLSRYLGDFAVLGKQRGFIQWAGQSSECSFCVGTPGILQWNYQEWKDVFTGQAFHNY